MNVFHKVALQSLKKNRSRTFITVVGVVLSTALFAGITTFGISLLHYMTVGAVAQYGDWQAGFLDVDAAFVQSCERDEAVAHTAVVEELGYAALEGGQDPGKPYWFVAGYDENAFDTLPIALFSGRLPQNSSEILIPASAAAKAGVDLALGDTLSLSLGERVLNGKTLGQTDPYTAGERLTSEATRTYTVVGVYLKLEFADTFRDSAATFPCVTRRESGEAAEEAARYSVFVKLNDPRTVHRHAGTRAAGAATVYNDKVLRFMGLSEDRLIDSLLVAVGGVAMLIIMWGRCFSSATRFVSRSMSAPINLAFSCRWGIRTAASRFGAV